MLSGSEAANVGLINQAFPDGTVIDEARAMAAHIAAGPTKAFKASKRILCNAPTLEDVLKAEAAWQGKIIKSQDAVEGFSAFQQKRKPKFVGN
jgi:enoyl-CoA hydratase/carnithine racemase